MDDEKEFELPPDLQADVEKEVYRLETEADVTKTKISERQRTIRVFFLCLFAVIAIAIICFTAVKIVEQPPWLILALAICGPTGTVVVFFTIYLKMRSRALDRWNAKLRERAKPPKNSNK